MSPAPGGRAGTPERTAGAIRPGHPIRATLSLIIIALALGVLLAAALGGVIWAIAAALHSASSA